jgi:hypothetical protein
MKKYTVMAGRDFDHRGTSRKAGQIFQMSVEDYEIWSGFVSIVSAALLPKKRVTKPASTAPRTTKGVTGGTK